MRQAIKGDGSDGTAELKAYLLAHDSVLSHELYEFIKPAIGASPAPGPEVPNATSFTTADSFVADSQWATFPDYAAYTIGPNFGTISRFHSRPWWAYHVPGDLYWTGATGLYAAPGGDAIGARPRSDIVSVIAVMDVQNILGALLETTAVSVDGGTTWHDLGGHQFSSSLTQLTLDITGLLGSIATFDFSQIKFTLSVATSIFDDSTSELAVSNIGLVFSYASATVTTPTTTPIVNLCDASSPLTYAGEIYRPAVIKNSGFKSKIGLAVNSLQLEWSFRGDEAFVTDPDTGETILTYLQALQYGLFEGVWVRWRRAYMPTFGDCDSLGAVSSFRGRIADIELDRLTARITVNSVTELFNRQVPQQLIEANNRSLQVGPGLPPDLDPNPLSWTYFNATPGHGGTVQKIVAEQTDPIADQVYAPGTFDLGYLWFKDAPLKDVIAQVQHYEVIAGFNVFYLFRPLYVDPNPRGLRFAAFIPVPKDQAVSGASGVKLGGFPFVPLPDQAV